jgi:predicted ArsR family transcriptional regulator
MTTRSKRKTTTSRNSGKGTTNPHETKRARLIGLLKRANGSDVAALSRELGWQQHTTRAALTGLRKAGFTIARVQGEGSRTATYRITAEPKAAAAQ